MSREQTPGGDPEPVGPERKRKPLWNWAYTPFLVIGIAIIPNAIMIMSARDRGVDAVLDNAYQAAGDFEAQQQERQRFTAAGLALDCTTTADGLRCSLTGLPETATTAPARLHFYRASDRSLDQTVDWPDTREPMTIKPPVRGNWFVEVVVVIDGERYRRREAVYY